MEDVAELVEHRLHLLVLEEGRPLLRRLRHIRDDGRDRMLIAAVAEPAAGHQRECRRMAELRLTREQVHVEVRDQFS